MKGGPGKGRTSVPLDASGATGNECGRAARGARRLRGAPADAVLLRVGFRPAFALAGSLGVLAAGSGYVLSWMWELPTGATMVAAAAALTVPGALFRLARG